MISLRWAEKTYPGGIKGEKVLQYYLLGKWRDVPTVEIEMVIGEQDDQDERVTDGKAPVALPSQSTG